MNNKIYYLLSNFILLTGLTLAITSHKLPLYFSLLIVMVGIYFINHFGGKIKEEIFSDNLKVADTKLKLKFKKYNVFFGLFLLLLIFLFEKLTSHKEVGDYTIITLFFSLQILFYNMVPIKYEAENNFLILFTAFLFLFLIVPNVFFELLKDYNIFEDNSFTLDTYVSIFLAKPLSIFLNFTGFQAQAIDNWLLYHDSSGKVQRVGIADSCSGIYSVLIFMCGFFSYVVNERKRFSSFNILYLLLIIGLLTSYIANLFRMYIIILVGIYYGGEELYWTHKNLGWLIFFFWMAAFWTLLFRFYESPNLYNSDLISKVTSSKEDSR